MYPCVCDIDDMSLSTGGFHGEVEGRLREPFLLCARSER